MGAILGVPPEGIWCWYRDFWVDCATGMFPSVGTTIERICTALGAEVDPARVMKAVQIRSEFTRRSLAASTGTIETLRHLRLAGYRIGLISDCARETPMVWQSNNLAPLVDTAVFSCMVGMKKPDPRIYQLASQRLEVRPADCLYVGDGSSRELSGALAAGMHAVLLRIPLDDAYDSQRAEVDGWRGPSISTLPDILSLLGYA
jgi:putative hydrolase of the HAD superfamily